MIEIVCTTYEMSRGKTYVIQGEPSFSLFSGYIIFFTINYLVKIGMSTFLVV